MTKLRLFEKNCEAENVENIGPGDKLRSWREHFMNSQAVKQALNPVKVCVFL